MDTITKVFEWARETLFTSVANGVITVVTFALLLWGGLAFLDWAIFSAVFTGSDGSACRGADTGACWPFVVAKLGTFTYGRYPASEIWRVNTTLLLAIAALVPLMIPRVGGKLWLSVYLLSVFPLLAFVLLRGGIFGLPTVDTSLWGGLLLTLVIASTAIVASFPLGILLALGRRSELPIVRWLSIGYIELVRGVPLVTVLFMASVMLPLFLPPDITIDKLLRALVGVSLFSAAYIAEVIRGGLQAIPRGQTEAAAALGLGYWRTQALVVVPQALKLVIPGLVNSFISLLKDTSLVLIIGLFDLTGVVEQAVKADAKWFAPSTAATGYVFAALVFWVLCFGISRYSALIERRLETAHRRS